MSRQLPENVIPTAALAWQTWAQASSPFGGAVKAMGSAALKHVGLHLERIDPGQRSCPLHDHLFEEEQFYVLQGVLTVTERSVDGRRREFELHPGELIVYPAGTRLAHGFSNRGDVPSVFLAFSGRHPGDICTYPDSDKTNFGDKAIGAWQKSAIDSEPAGAGVRSTVERQLERAAERRRAEKVERVALAARPAHVVRGVEERALGGEPPPGRLYGADLSRAGGAEQVFLHRHRLPAGRSPQALHRHRFDEELVLLLDGELCLRQVGDSGDESVTPLVAGDWVWWRPRELAHQIRNDSDRDVHYLALGTGRAWDVIDYPESGEILSRGLGERGRLEVLDYFAGELEG